MICRTAEEAWEAGQSVPCEHGARLAECERCRLTPEEIARLAALHRPYLQAPPPAATTAA